MLVEVHFQDTNLTFFQMAILTLGLLFATFALAHSGVKSIVIDGTT
jgi:hypothetical protein